MIIWLINPGEPLPIDNNQRLLRSGKLAYALKDDNEVIWFCSKFDHFTKKFRQSNEKEFDGIKYYFINSIGYKNNLSLRRLLDHVILGLNLLIKILKLKEKPDIIITSYPPIETSFFISLYCKINKIKLICDVRDLWPYTFPHLFKNKFYKILCNIFIIPWVICSKIIFKNTIVITISDGFSNWLQKYSIKQVKKFYLSYEKKEIIEKLQYFKDLKISDDDFIISFVGNYSKIKFDFDVIFDVADEIYSFSKNIKFIFCGDLKNIDNKYISNKYKNVFFFDWINREDMRKLLNISKIGLAPYKDLWDFNMSIPNKISEYLCYETPILSSLKGDTKNLINKYNCGINFDLNDKKNFVENIKFVYENKEYYNNLKAGAIQASKNFTDNKVIGEMKNFILS
jgi:glycosyltransferase involved in cell wall biosynthesis|tara:strand:+ start:427 stop:1620 length:1194 start_codon:yes stop_codon:yes gene_type:complete